MSVWKIMISCTVLSGLSFKLKVKNFLVAFKYFGV